MRVITPLSLIPWFPDWPSYTLKALAHYFKTVITPSQCMDLYIAQTFFFVIFVNPIEKRVIYEKNYTNNNANECSFCTKGLQ